MAQLKPGDRIPEFEAITDTDEIVRSSDLKGKKVILYFYPKDNTSGCTNQACLFRDHYPEIEGKGAIVLGVSPDSAASHRKFREKYNLPFTLLVDSDHSLAESFGAWGEKSMYGKKYMGVIRSHFVIDSDGTLVDVQYKISPKKSAPKALEVL